MQAETNYIYIIFAVVYVIYSIIKASKKVTKNRPVIDKKPSSSPTVNPPTSSPLPENNSGDDLKKMLEDLLGGGGDEEEIPEKPVVMPKTIHAQERQHPVTTHPGTIAKDKHQVKQTVPATTFVAHPEVVEKASVPVLQEEEAGVDFDIRQAVIYSEILKRPEY
jgi:hypothetical protein